MGVHKHFGQLTPTDIGLARRGGLYVSSATNMPGGSGLHQVTLSTSSGDNLITSGNIVVPTGGGGVWALSATWLAAVPNDNSPVLRAFIDIRVDTPSIIVRSSVGLTEDRATATTTLALAAGAVISVHVYYASQPSFGAPKLETQVSAYRIGA